MALDVIDGLGAAKTLKTTLDGSDHVPHHIVDNFPSGGSTEATLSAILAKIITSPATEAKQDTQISAFAAILAKIIAAPATEAKQDTQITALGTLGTQTTLAAVLAKLIAAPSTEAKQDTGNTSLASILAKIIAAPATEAKQDTLLAAILPTLSSFRSLTVNSTAQAIKGSAGELWGFNIINLDTVDIFAKIYNVAAASVNPASDVPILTLFVPANGVIYQEPSTRLHVHSTAISVRAVTGSGDTNTTAPSTLPIIEIKYS